jgi:hypothetical protein
MKKWHALRYPAVTLLAVGCLFAQAQQSTPQKPNPPVQKNKSQQAAKPPRKRVVTDLSGFDLLEPSKVQKQTTVVGATRGLPRPVALAPLLGKLFGTTPEFAWSCGGDFHQFVLVVRDDTEQEVFRAPVTGNTFRYPPDAPPLKPEKNYFWTVEIPSTILGPTSKPAGLLVISSGERAEIEKKLAQVTGDSYDAGLARARVFTDYRLWYDALAAYTDLITRYPDRSELYEQRGTIYAQLEVTKNLAERDFKLADDLRLRKK